MDERPLTPAEIAMARSIFGDAIDYARVRMIRRKWWPFQPKNAAMAPSGHIHFHPQGKLWSEDFSREPLWLQGFWIHEMAHVWQAQRHGRFYLPLMRHPFCRYGYKITARQRFGNYGIEQQAEMVRHVFLLRRGYRLENAPALEELEGVLPFTPVFSLPQQAPAEANGP